MPTRNHHTLRASNGRFTPKPTRPGRPRKHTNLFHPLPDSELLKVCPKKFQDLARQFLGKPEHYGYAGHRQLLCTYLQAQENLRRLEGKMGDLLVSTRRLRSAPKVMGKLKGMKLMDLYQVCVQNGIEVPFGSRREQLLTWLCQKAEAGTLTLEPPPAALARTEQA